MADKKITDLGTPSGGPASGDKTVLVDVSDTTDNAAGSSRADTLTNIITKGHGLSDGVVKVATGTMGVATEGTDYYKPGGTDVAVADGGTGSSTAATARTALGLAIGTDVQAQNARLADIAGITYAQGDVLYYNGTNIVKLAAGTSGQFLQTLGAAANPAWATTTGQTVYDAIVASSGGTHTTLGAAITAASAGWRILVLDSTTESGAITSSLAGLEIVGAGRNTAIGLGANVLTLSGANVTIHNVSITMSTGGVVMSGVIGTLENVFISTTAIASSNVTLSGAGSRMIGGEIKGTSVSACSSPYLVITGKFASCEYVKFTITNLNNTGTTSSAVYMNTNDAQSFSHNTIDIPTTTANAGFLYLNGGAFVNINDNQFYSLTAVIATLFDVRSSCNIINNGGWWCSNIINGQADNLNIVGNNMQTRSVANTFAITLASNTDRSVVANNNIFSGGAATSVGIYVASGNENSVTGNVVGNFTTGIRVDAGARNTVVGNTLNNNTTYILDTGTSTTIRDNTPNDINLDKRYVEMKNTSGGALAAGNLVVIKAVANGDEVTTSTTAGDNKVFGMAVTAPANNAYSQIQTLGKTTLLKVDGTTDIAIGDYISHFTTAGIGQKATAGQTAIAIALEAYTTNDSNGVIDALLIPPRLI